MPPQASPSKMLDFPLFNLLQTLLLVGTEKISDKNTQTCPRINRQLQAYQSGWSNRLCVWKGHLLLTKVWFDHSWHVRPERKQVEPWSGHLLRWNSCWANRKGIFEGRAPGFIERPHTHPSSFHELSAYSGKHTCKGTHTSLGFTDHMNIYTVHFYKKKIKAGD